MSTEILVAPASPPLVVFSRIALALDAGASSGHRRQGTGDRRPARLGRTAPAALTSNLTNIKSKENQTMYHAPIIMNGTPYRVLPGLTIATLLRDRGLAPETVVVELNGCAMTPSETKATPLQSGDVLEVVSNVARGWCGTASPPGEEVFQS